MSLTDRDKIMADLNEIRSRVPFDGIDWDLEGSQIDVDAMVDISLRLKDTYGPPRHQPLGGASSPRPSSH